MAAVDARGLPRAAVAQHLGRDLLELAPRTECKAIDVGVDRQRQRRTRRAVAGGSLQEVLAVQARGMDVGAPTAAGTPADAAGQIVAADQQPPDIDVVDTLAVAAQRHREAPLESGGLDLDQRALREFLVLEVEDELCRPWLIGRFFPACLGD